MDITLKQARMNKGTAQNFYLLKLLNYIKIYRDCRSELRQCLKPFYSKNHLFKGITADEISVK